MTLDVFLFDKKCGELFSTANQGIVFEYDQQYLHDKNSLPLSVSLPLMERTFTQKECVPYFYGLLPEGDVKRKIANELHVSESSTLKLLAALGGECAGTVSLFNAESDYKIPQRKYEFTPQNYELISESDIAKKISESAKTPFIRSQENYRLSLAGAQQKLALAHCNGKWYIPKNGAPSTHIIKPARTDYPDISANEYLCMKIAKEFLEDVPNVELVPFAAEGKIFNVFCVERFDRNITIEENGTKIERLHQEDFCQVLGIMGDKKYQNDGGPGTKDIINVLREKSTMPTVDIQKAAEYFVFQYLIGNCDAHGKNYSLLHNGGLRLAPAYDIVSTVMYPELSRRLSMKVADHYEIDKISKRHFIETFDACGVNAKMTNMIFDKFAGKIPAAEKLLENDAVAADNPALTEKIVARVKACLGLA